MKKVAERAQKHLLKQLAKENPRNEKEAQEALDRIIADYNKDPDAHLYDAEPETDLDRADLLIEQAEDEESAKKAIKLLNQAIDICDYACDAYLMLADIEANPFQSIEILETGIKKYEEHEGDGFFKENEGHFWGLLGTRPYMRCLGRLAILLTNIGCHTEAIDKMKYMLKLCPNDNIGIRYHLITSYVFLEKFKEAEKLFTKYDEDNAFMLYPFAIMKYKQRNMVGALALFKEAYQANKHVLDFLAGKKNLDFDDENTYYSYGSKEEAKTYINAAASLLFSAPGLTLFLERHYNTISKKSKVN